jgi:hypothetical protein
MPVHDSFRSATECCLTKLTNIRCPIRKLFRHHNSVQSSDKQSKLRSEVIDSGRAGTCERHRCRRSPKRNFHHHHERSCEPNDLDHNCLLCWCEQNNHAHDQRGFTEFPDTESEHSHRRNLFDGYVDLERRRAAVWGYQLPPLAETQLRLMCQRK